MSDPCLIDSHCHLDMFAPEELEGMLARAGAAGVGGMVTIGTRLTEAHRQIELAGTLPGVWCTIGVHPNNAGEHPTPDPRDIVALAEAPRVIGIGESGLDYFYDTAPPAAQQASFRAHIEAARITGLPLVIHARDADADIDAILREQHALGAFPFLLHCFSSGAPLAHTALELGGYISVSGMLTFPKSSALRDLAAVLPADRLLVETDAPFLAPKPFRGKRNEPSYVAHTAAVLAEIRGLSQAALAELTTRNFRRLFARA